MLDIDDHSGEHKVRSTSIGMIINMVSCSQFEQVIRFYLNILPVYPSCTWMTLLLHISFFLNTRMLEEGTFAQPLI